MHALAVCPGLQGAGALRNTPGHARGVVGRPALLRGAGRPHKAPAGRLEVRATSRDEPQVGFRHPPAPAAVHGSAQPPAWRRTLHQLAQASAVVGLSVALSLSSVGSAQAAFTGGRMGGSSFARSSHSSRSSSSSSSRGSSSSSSRGSSGSSFSGRSGSSSALSFGGGSSSGARASAPSKASQPGSAHGGGGGSSQAGAAQRGRAALGSASGSGAGAAPLGKGSKSGYARVGSTRAGAALSGGSGSRAGASLSGGVGSWAGAPLSGGGNSFAGGSLSGGSTCAGGSLDAGTSSCAGAALSAGASSFAGASLVGGSTKATPSSVRTNSFFLSPFGERLPQQRAAHAAAAPTRRLAAPPETGAGAGAAARRRAPYQPGPSRRPPMGLGFGYGYPVAGFGGGGLLSLLFWGTFAVILFQVAQGVLRNRAGGYDDYSYGTGNTEGYDEVVTVGKVQVGLLANARELQRDLERLADTADTDSPRGLHYILQETVLALMRNPDFCVYGFAKSKRERSAEDAENAFNQLSLQERTKFEQETRTNVGGFTKRAALKSTKEVDPGQKELIVVTLLVAADGSFKLPQVDSRASLKEALSIVGAVRADDLLAVEVLWTPEDEGDHFTVEDLAYDYPTLNTL